MFVLKNQRDRCVSPWGRRYRGSPIALLYVQNTIERSNDMIIVSSPRKGRCPEPSPIPETLNYQPPLNAITANQQHTIDPYAPNYHSIISNFISTGETCTTPSRTVCSPATEGRIRRQRIRRAVDTVDSYCKIVSMFLIRANLRFSALHEPCRNAPTPVLMTTGHHRSSRLY